MNHHPFGKPWNAVGDLLEMGKRKPGFWVHRGKLELKRTCWSCQQHPCHVPGYGKNQELPEARSTSLAESNLLGNPSSATLASRLHSFAPVLETFLWGWAKSEVGSSCFAPAKPKEVRLEEQVVQTARSWLSYWKALPLFLICMYMFITSLSYEKVLWGLRRAFNPKTFPWFPAKREKWHMWRYADERCFWWSELEVGCSCSVTT